jgi:hypothetical protein
VNNLLPWEPGWQIEIAKPVQKTMCANPGIKEGFAGYFCSSVYTTPPIKNIHFDVFAA